MGAERGLRGFATVFLLASLAAVGVGAFVAAQSGVAPGRWGLNLAAWVVGLGGLTSTSMRNSLNCGDWHGGTFYSASEHPSGGGGTLGSSFESGQGRRSSAPVIA